MDKRRKQGLEMYELGLRLGGLGTVAIGTAGGPMAEMLGRCMGCGVALAGGEARFHDGSCAACGVWLAGYYNLPAAVFLRQEREGISLRVTDGQGRSLAIPERRERGPSAGSWDWITGADSGWAARRIVPPFCRRTVAAQGPPALRLLLERMGCHVAENPRPGMPLLRMEEEGFRLWVEWNGGVFSPPGEDGLEAAAGWLSRGWAVPAFRAERL